MRETWKTCGKTWDGGDVSSFLIESSAVANSSCKASGVPRVLERGNVSSVPGFFPFSLGFFLFCLPWRRFDILQSLFISLPDV